MVINKVALNKSFEICDKETIREIIDLFFEDYPERVNQLTTALNKHDSELLHSSAQGLKSVLAYFHADEPRKLAKELEEKGAANDFEGTTQIKDNLLIKIEEMLEELKDIKKEYK